MLHLQSNCASTRLCACGNPTQHFCQPHEIETESGFPSPHSSVQREAIAAGLSTLVTSGHPHARDGTKRSTAPSGRRKQWVDWSHSSAPEARARVT